MTDQPKQYKVVFEFPDGTTHIAQVRSDEYVLTGANRCGIDLPVLCAQGWDVVCAVKILEGKPLDHSDALRYYKEDEEAGFALICTAKPRSDLRLKTHQSAAMRRHRQAHGLPAPHGGE